MMGTDRGIPPEFAFRHVVGDGRGEVVVRASRHGADLLVSVGGGATHVGAVAVASPAGGTAGEDCEGCLVVPGHKEGPLALEYVRRLAAFSGATCVAVVGIHIDRATREEIDTLVANARAGLEALLVALGSAGS
jgi:hypothetical protein